MSPAGLMDSNIIIDYDAGVMSESCKAKVSAMIDAGGHVSVMTEMEVLRYDGTPEEMIRLESLCNGFTIYPLTRAIVERTIKLCRGSKIKLVDAIIAATALEHGLALVTRNVDDFKTVGGLEIINPWE